jgi:hypothetical protein
MLWFIYRRLLFPRSQASKIAREVRRENRGPGLASRSASGALSRSSVEPLFVSGAVIQVCQLSLHDTGAVIVGFLALVAGLAVALSPDPAQEYVGAAVQVLAALAALSILLGGSRCIGAASQTALLSAVAAVLLVTLGLVLVGGILTSRLALGALLVALVNIGFGVLSLALFIAERDLAKSSTGTLVLVILGGLLFALGGLVAASLVAPERGTGKARRFVGVFIDLAVAATAVTFTLAGPAACRELATLVAAAAGLLLAAVIAGNVAGRRGAS